MNNYCRELNFTPELYPKLDFSKYNTNGYDWSTFHKTPSPSELNNNHLFEYLESLGLYCKFIEFFAVISSIGKTVIGVATETCKPDIQLRGKGIEP